MTSSILATSFLHLKTSSSTNPPPSLLHFSLHSQTSLKPIKASISPPPPPSSGNNNHKHPILRSLKALTKTAILVATTASLAARFSVLPSRAETPSTLTEETQAPILEEEQEANERKRDTWTGPGQSSSPLSDFLESNAEAIESLKSLLQQKLESGEDKEALKILERLVAAQPSVTDWKLLMARLLNEMGQTRNARSVFEEILAANPLSFEALFENALLMDRCGEGESVIKRLEEALEIAQEENKAKEARDVRLIIAQIQFLQKNVEEALRSYHELSKEDPGDFRPYFCRGMVYSLLDRNEEAREEFAKYRELSPKKFEVEGYLRTPLSRMKIFGANEEK